MVLSYCVISWLPGRLVSWCAQALGGFSSCTHTLIIKSYLSHALSQLVAFLIIQNGSQLCDQRVCIHKPSYDSSVLYVFYKSSLGSKT